MAKKAIRASVLTFQKDPFFNPLQQCYTFWEDALIIIEDGKIVSVEDYKAEKANGLQVEHYPNAIVSAGFIDCHLHYPQTQMIGAFGKQLIDWLNTYTFVAEQDFGNQEHASYVAQFFLKELLRNGTTTASVYASVHPESAEAFFQASSKLNTRMICGKVLMDRNAPEKLLDTPTLAYEETSKLIKKWHENGRQLYAITPRFAPTSTEAQLEVAEKLWQENPSCYLQSHLSENLGELAWVKELFPKHNRYLDVYKHYNLVNNKSLYGHCVHLAEDDFQDFHNSQATMVHCPTSNFFLGSGLFKLFEAKKKNRPVKVGLGTDVGGGTSFSMFVTLNEAYKMAQLNGTPLNSFEGFYLATKGGAEALNLADKIGSVAPGIEADLMVIDLKATPLIEFRMKYAKTLAEKLFVLMTLADDRSIKATYVAGEKVYTRS